MRGDRFFDTNILIYAFAAGNPRSTKAEALLAEGGMIDVQVLNEFTNVVGRKPSWDLPQVEAALAMRVAAYSLPKTCNTGASWAG